MALQCLMQKMISKNVVATYSGGSKKVKLPFFSVQQLCKYCAVLSCTAECLLETEEYIQKDVKIHMLAYTGFLYIYVIYLRSYYLKVTPNTSNFDTDVRRHMTKRTVLARSETMRYSDTG